MRDSARTTARGAAATAARTSGRGGDRTLSRRGFLGIAVGAGAAMACASTGPGSGGRTASCAAYDSSAPKDIQDAMLAVPHPKHWPKECRCFLEDASRGRCARVCKWASDHEPKECPADAGA